MNREPEFTQTNVLPNGRFDLGYDHWESANSSEDWYLKSDSWEGLPLWYMSIYRGAGIRQRVPPPVARSEGANYRLSFLYDNRGNDAGTFSLRRLGTDDSLEIVLEPRSGALADGDKALTLREVTASIDFEVEEDDLFEFVIMSPTSATASKDIQIARIDFHLELEPLVLAHIVNSGQTHAVGTQPQLYLCYGATGEYSHQLSFRPASGSPWVGTEALLWSHDNPDERVLVTPEWGENQLVESNWKVDCPRPISDETLQFNLLIYSKYHAETYPIAVSLGHHRLVVESVLEPTHQPVIEYGQSVKLGVLVKSYYVDQPMPNCSVSWVLGGDVVDVGTTDESGYAEFYFAPRAAGSLEIEARVDSPFYASGNTARRFIVKAHASDPLKTVQVKFPRMDPALWGEKTGYPDRGATYRLDVTLAADSPLLNEKVSLEWDGKDPAELGVTAAPAFSQPVSVTGTSLSWTLTCEDRFDGDFQLCLACAELLKPTVNNLMSLARHNLEIGDVREANRIPVVDENDYVWCMLRVLSQAKNPVAGVLVEWETPRGLQRTYSGTDGWASVIDRPTEHGDYTLLARVNPREGAVPLEHEFDVETLRTSAWKTASFKLDAVAIDRVGAGAVCRMGQRYVFHLTVEPDSPLIGKSVSLRWQYPARVDSIDITDMGVPVTIDDTGAQWSVDARVAENSGVFDLQVISDGVEPLDLAFRSLPEDLSAEVDLVFDQMPKDWGTAINLYPCLGAIHDLTLRPLNDLGGLHGLLLRTAALPDLPSGWVISPALSDRPAMTAGGVRYRCDFTGTTSAAQRSWTVQLMGVDGFIQPPAFGLKLAHNKVVIDTPYEVATDPVLSKGESVRLALRYRSTFTGGPANDVGVEWDDATTSVSGADGIAQYSYAPAAAGGHDIQALARNLYDDTQIEHIFAVYAHENDPWLDLKVEYGSGGELPWGEQTFFPRREDRLGLLLHASEGSPLLGQALALGLSGADELDMKIGFTPALGAPRQLTGDGLEIDLAAGDQTDAAFYLQLSASRLLERSPLNAFSLGSHIPVDVAAGTHADVVVDWGETLFFEVSLTNALTGQPARNVRVTWDSTDEAIEPVETIANFYGVARFSFIATVHGPGTITASAMGGAEAITFDYLVHEACKISLTSDRLEGLPGEEVNAEVTVVSAATNEPVAGVKVHWFLKGVVLEPVFTDALGKAQITFELPPRIGSYVLSARVRGEFGWDSDWLSLKVLGTADSWWQEFTLWLNEVPIFEGDGVIRGVNLVHATTSILELRVNKDSSLINATDVKLQGEAGPQVTYTPPFYESRRVTMAPMPWIIVTQMGAFGSFKLELHSPALPVLELQASVIG